jgi:hypothetical protein
VTEAVEGEGDHMYESTTSIHLLTRDIYPHHRRMYTP